MFGSSYKLNELLDNFYVDVLVKKYKLGVINENRDTHLNEDEISRVHLSDTRHIAIMGAFLNTNDIMLASRLAGHKNVNDTMHYLQNIKEYTKAAVYECYKDCNENKYNFFVSKEKYLLKKEYARKLSNGTYCIARSNQDYDENNSFSECISVLGHCEFCKFHRISLNDKKYDIKREKNCEGNIDFSISRIKKLIELVRKEKGHETELEEEWLSLQTEIVSYEEILIDNLRGH